ncbi:hypothetical protein Ddc_12470 [Ditylenchus destructor]|nr:hypothetical protein Ddc_12470 [Ditylenchus destructor]
MSECPLECHLCRQQNKGLTTFSSTNTLKAHISLEHFGQSELGRAEYKSAKLGNLEFSERVKYFCHCGNSFPTEQLLMSHCRECDTAPGEQEGGKFGAKIRMFQLANFYMAGGLYQKEGWLQRPWIENNDSFETDVKTDDVRIGIATSDPLNSSHLTKFEVPCQVEADPERKCFSSFQDVTFSQDREEDYMCADSSEKPGNGHAGFQDAEYPGSEEFQKQMERKVKLLTDLWKTNEDEEGMEEGKSAEEFVTVTFEPMNEQSSEVPECFLEANIENATLVSGVNSSKRKDKVHIDESEVSKTPEDMSGLVEVKIQDKPKNYAKKFRYDTPEIEEIDEGLDSDSSDTDGPKSSGGSVASGPKTSKDQTSKNKRKNASGKMKAESCESSKGKPPSVAEIMGHLRNLLLTRKVESYSDKTFEQCLANLPPRAESSCNVRCVWPVTKGDCKNSGGVFGPKYDSEPSDDSEFFDDLDTSDFEDYFD